MLGHHTTPSVQFLLQFILKVAFCTEMQGQLYEYPYGLRSRKIYSELDLELRCYIDNHPPEKGGLGAEGHFKRITEILWPEKKPHHFVWHPWADRMLAGAVANRYFGIIGCASSGKSDFGAVWAIVNWLCAPLDTLVLVTSTSLKDSRKRIWGAIAKYWHASSVRLPGKMVDSMGIIRTDDGSGKFVDTRGISLIAGEKKKEKEAIGKIIGSKNTRVFLIADELPELSEAILEAAYSNLDVNPFFQLIGIGNFASMYDPLGVFVEPKTGYDSITPEDQEWETKRGWCLRLDGLKSPNILSGEDKWPIYNSKNLARHRANLGETTSGFWRMVRSFPCPAGSEDVIYTEPDFVRGKVSYKPEWLEPPVPVAGLDPSFTNGGDRSVLVLGYCGRDVEGVNIVWMERYVLLRENVMKTDVPRNFQIANMFMNECVKFGVLPINAALDATGAGSPFYDIVAQTWSKQVLGVQFGGYASNFRVAVNDSRPAFEHYVNRVSELWYVGSNLMKFGQLRGMPNDLAREMKSRRYELVKGASSRIKVEPKRDMKERLGFSPDLADALFIMVDLCRTRLGLIAGNHSGGYVREEMDHKEEVERANAVYANVDYSEQEIPEYASYY